MNQSQTPKFLTLSLITTTGQEIPVPGNHFIIGRNLDCHLRLDSITVSRRHTLITREADGCYVEDLGSAHITQLNHQPVGGRRRLANGDELLLGEVKLTVRLR